MSNRLIFSLLASGFALGIAITNLFYAITFFGMTCG